MTDKEKAEKILQTKGCNTFCAKGCGYTEKVIELIAIGLAEGRKEGYEKGLDTFPNTKRENRVLKEQNEELKKENEELKAENKKLKSEWKSCFLSCSSPYCAGHFPAVKMEGELGNMSKHEGE